MILTYALSPGNQSFTTTIERVAFTIKITQKGDYVYIDAIRKDGLFPRFGAIALDNVPIDFDRSSKIKSKLFFKSVDGSNPNVMAIGLTTNLFIDDGL